MLAAYLWYLPRTHHARMACMHVCALSILTSTYLVYLLRQARPGAELGSVNGARQRARYAHACCTARRSSTQLGACAGGEAAQ